MKGYLPRTIAPATMALLLLLAGLVLACGDAAVESTSITEATTTITAAPSTTATPASAAPTSGVATSTTLVATTTPQPTGPPTLVEVEGYQQWLKMNIEPIKGSTHGLTDIYVNQARETIAPDGELILPFPEGTVIVKEILEGDKVAIMRKAADIDPEHGDWQWIEYRTDGSIVGQDAGCWGCHAAAESTDWVFTRLETP